MVKKIIFFTGDIETLDYFSQQLANAFQAMGYKTFLFDFSHEKRCFKQLKKFIDYGETIVITFNFTGIRGDDIFYQNNGSLFFDTHEIPCYNIVVDHPFYYHKMYPIRPKNYIQISIDRLHEQYMQRFYPEISLGGFLPLAGTSILHTSSPSKKEYDVVFTGNYTPPSQFEKQITRLNDEYTAFYRSILAELISHPYRDIAEVFIEYLKKEMPDISDTDAAECMSNMIFLDLYVRFYFRGKIIQTLVDAQIAVHVFGSGWNLLPVKHPENLVIHGPVDSAGCLENIAKSKVSLNIMPWFKNGAHDRIFNTMLNQSVCVTDTSIYLKEILTDNENVIFYDLESIDSLPEKIFSLLNNPDKQNSICQQGFSYAKNNHTWADRAHVLESLFL